MQDQYSQFRRFYEDVSGAHVVLVGENGTIPLVLSRGNIYSIFVQRIHVRVNAASAGVTWTLRDNNGVPVNLTGALSAAVAPTSFEIIDYGPKGVPLTPGKELDLIISAAGGGGIVTWEAYQRLTAADFAAATN